MPYNVIWDNYALDNLNKLESSIVNRILKKIDEFSSDPFSHDIKKLKGDLGYRLRVGDYRVIFDIEKDIITILKVGHRKNIYDR
ncbi:type II toxin-antitoxin system RelE/ParE family toxin [Candidatus Pacearchaeota archaeon CG10_big_fil_rev_8_21_14_0_10_32_14]|nr:MAG: type II toxin-antitoxin system RelE/ParE family toxin [Candidatus Pacearchaeota archaeon CG10_big_fil_rev_8_21_14_0_10_32_14]